MSRPSRWALRRTTWYELLTKRHVLVVVYVPYRGFHSRSIRARGGLALDRLAIWGPPEFSMKRIQPGQQGPNGSATHLAAVETNLFDKLAALVAHMTVVKYDDGEPRKPGWITIKTMGAAWSVQVKDPDGCAQLQATAQSLDDALCLADLLVGSEQAPWEPDAFLQKAKKK